MLSVMSLAVVVGADRHNIAYFVRAAFAQGQDVVCLKVGMTRSRPKPLYAAVFATPGSSFQYKTTHLRSALKYF